jgi:hypothetical protein
LKFGAKISAEIKMLKAECVTSYAPFRGSIWNFARMFANGHVHSHDDLTTNEAFVLIAIANHAPKGKAQAYPSVAKLQKTTKLSRRAVAYALRGLEEKKAI